MKHLIERAESGRGGMLYLLIVHHVRAVEAMIRHAHSVGAPLHTIKNALDMAIDRDLQGAACYFSVEVESHSLPGGNCEEYIVRLVPGEHATIMYPDGGYNHGAVVYSILVEGPAITASAITTEPAQPIRRIVRTRL